MLRLRLVVPILLVAACGKTPRPADDDMAQRSSRNDSTAPSPGEPRGKVTLLGTRAAATVAVEVVKSRAAITRGLMFREQMAPDDGMLFLMDRDEVHTFWMRNTLIPLDMIFIGKDMKVVGVVERATPRTDALRSVDAPSRYVLEVNGGWAAAHGIGAGATVRFEGVEAIAR